MACFCEFKCIASPQKIIGKAIEEDNYDSRIVGGSEVKAHSVPHQAALVTSFGTFCGGKKSFPNFCYLSY